MFRFLIYSNLWVAICFSLLTYLGFVQREIFPDYYYLAFSFFSVLGVYNLQRWIKLSTHDSSSSRDQWLSDRKIQLLVFGGISIILSGLAYALSDFADWQVIISCSVLTFLYLPPKQLQFLELRKFPLIKLFLVGAVWSILSLPDLFYLEDYGVAFFRMLWIVAITIPFDLRDVYKDQKDGIKNLASLMSKKKVVVLSSTLFLIGIIGELLFLYQDLEVYLLSVFVSWYLLLEVKSTSKDWYIAGLIESIPAMYFLNYLIS